jgi:transposase
LKGRLAKADRLDARMIREFVKTSKPDVLPPARPACRFLDELIGRHQQLTDFQAAEKTRFLQASEQMHTIQECFVE